MVLKSLAAMTLGWCCCTVGHAAPSIVVVPDAAFLSPQMLVPVDGPRRLNLYCIGSGTPVVMVDSAMGGGMMFWRHVLLPIGALTRTCIYDRAGYGFSDPATRASDATNAVDDLHRLLKAAAIPTPVIYVGHSLAGLYGLLFAATYPSELAGAVLIDPSIAHHDAVMTASMTPRQRAEATANESKTINDMKNCLSLARAGALSPPTTKAAVDCMDTSSNPEKVDDALAREQAHQWSLPPSNAAVLSEFISDVAVNGQTDLDSTELDASPPHFGNRPLIILTPGPSAEAPIQDKAAAAVWSTQHDLLAKLSTRGTNRVVGATGHYIQVDQPNAVIDAVLTVVTELHTDAKHKGD